MDKEYAEYLKSDKWKLKRQQLFEERGKTCERCKSEKDIQVHHKTYKNIFNEKLCDLEVLCKICHQNHHKKKIEKNIKEKPKKEKKVKQKKPKWQVIKTTIIKFFVQIRKYGSKTPHSFGFKTEDEALKFHQQQSKTKHSEFIGGKEVIVKHKKQIDPSKPI